MNPFKIIKYQLYLLQLENYEITRFWKLLFKKGLWAKGEQRKSLVWTAKAKLLFALAVALHLLLIILLVSNFGIWNLIFGILLIPFYFVFFALALWLLWPAEFVVKQWIIGQAKSKIKNQKSKITVIGIAGSYGKTTMKEVLHAVLSAKYKVAAAPESVNTPVGIARWVLKNFPASPSPVSLWETSSPARGEEDMEIAIVEMGEYYRGDIKYLCSITPPDIAVVTGINEAHLERMKTLENITDTIFEIVSGTKAGGTVFLNSDDKLVEENYKKYIWPDHALKFFSKNFSSAKSKVKSAKFDAEKLQWILHVEDLGETSLNLLGEYALGDFDAAIKIGQALGMSPQELKLGIAKIRPIEHRLQPIPSAGDVLVIDDSYNSNPAGAAEAIRVLSRFTNRRRIYITPGMVEMGSKIVELHQQIGKQLAKVADVVILIRNSVTGFIEEGVLSMSFRPTSRNLQSEQWIPKQVRDDKKRAPEIIWFNTAQEAHASLSSILKPGDVVMFQNDWGDQYI